MITARTGAHTGLPTDEVLLKSAGSMAYLKAQLDSLEDQLRLAPSWEPGQALLGQIGWVRDRISEIEETWTRKLVVAIAGPSGSGKSTLLNALAGCEISPTGLLRPTTRQIVVYCQATADVSHLLRIWPENKVNVQVTPNAPGLEHLILIDTPDTNTVPENQQLLGNALEAADIILTVFAAQNPKLEDNAAFLGRHVRFVGTKGIIPVLNAVDRVPLEQLTDEIVPDLRQFLEQEWQITPPRIFLVSSLSSARDRQFAPDEYPLHNLNEFEELRRHLYEHLNTAEQVVDQRLSRGEHLVASIRMSCRQFLSASKDQRRQAQRELQSLSEQSRQVAASLLVDGLNPEYERARVELYSELAHRWWGPIGWLVGIWAVGLRLTRPRRQREYEFLGSYGKVEPRRLAPQWQSATRQLYAERWPPLADLMVASGFSSMVRRQSYWELESDAVTSALGSSTGRALESSIGRLSSLLSSWVLQMLFNIPPLGMVIWIAYCSLISFFTRNYLPSEFYQSGVVALLTVCLGTFALLQMLFALSSKRMIRRSVHRSLEGALPMPTLSNLQDELQALEELALSCRDTGRE